MSRVHHERLLVGHLAQVFHHQAVLCPVLEDGAIAAVDDELVGMLCHARIQVVLDHQHDGSSLTRACRILVDGTGIHLIFGAIAVHVDAAVFFQFLGKLRSQGGMEMLGEVAQSVPQGEFLLLGGEDVLALGRMVNLGVVGLQFGQFLGDATANVGNEFFSSHIYLVLVYLVTKTL